MIPDQDSRTILRLALGLGGFVLILAGMFYFSSLVNEVLLAAFLTLLLVPLSSWLQRHGLSRTWANVLVLLLVVFAVAVLILFLVFSLTGLVSELPNYESGLDDTESQIQSSLASLGLNGDSVASAVASASKTILGIGASIAAGMVGYIVDGVFTILIFAFMLFDAAGFRTRMQRAFSMDHSTLERIYSSTASVAIYLRLLTYINLAIGVADSIFLWFLGIPNPVLWGVLAFVTGYIPFIGYWIAMIPVMIVAYLHGGLVPTIIVFIGYWLINGTLSNVVAPRVYGKGLNLSPVITLVAVLFWGAILGPVGAMLAVPLTAIGNSVLLSSYPETRWLSILMREGDGTD
ncbi:MAG: AI-2E family transporter [Caldilineaceae bacterium]